MVDVGDAVAPERGYKGLTVGSVAALVAVAIGSFARAWTHMNLPGQLDNPVRWALTDFRDAVYYPVVSFLSGGNPFDTDRYMAALPAGVPFPPYSPSTLLLHLPFGLFPHVASQLTFFGLTLALTVILAWLILRICRRRPTVTSVSILATLILVTRPGHWNLMLGQITVELVIAVYGALYLAGRSIGLSAVAIAVACVKPTYGLPLLLMMLAHRHHRAVVLAVLITAVSVAIPTAILVHSSGGFHEFRDSLVESYGTIDDQVTSSPDSSPYRVDAFAFVNRLTGASPGPIFEIGLFLLTTAVAAAAIMYARARTTGHATDLVCMSIASLAILIASYQLSYNLLLLTLPLTALTLNRTAMERVGMTSVVRCVLLVLLAVPMVNFLESWRVLHHLETGSSAWLLLTSINATALLAAFAIYLVLAFRVGPPSPAAAATPAADDPRGGPP